MPSNIERIGDQCFIKAQRCADGFTFDLSLQHVIEQTLLRAFNSPSFRKSTIYLSGEASDETAGAEKRMRDRASSKDMRGIPIKLQLKRQYAEKSGTSATQHEEGGDNSQPCDDQPLDMRIKRRSPPPPTHCRKTAAQSTQSVSAVPTIPPEWRRGLAKGNHEKWRRAVANASLSPFQRKKARKIDHSHGNGVQRVAEALPSVCPSATPVDSSNIYDLSSKLIQPKKEPCRVEQMTRCDDNLNTMDKYLAQALMTIANDPPTQRPTLHRNQPSSVKITDLIGSIVERKLMPPSADSLRDSPRVRDLTRLHHDLI